MRKYKKTKEERARIDVALKAERIATDTALMRKYMYGTGCLTTNDATEIGVVHLVESLQFIGFVNLAWACSSDEDGHLFCFYLVGYGECSECGGFNVSGVGMGDCEDCSAFSTSDMTTREAAVRRLRRLMPEGRITYGEMDEKEWTDLLP